MMANIDVDLEHIQLEPKPVKQTRKRKPKKQHIAEKPPAIFNFLVMSDFWDSSSKIYHKQGDVIQVDNLDNMPPHCKKL